MSLPPDFTSYASTLFADETWQRYLDSFNEMPPVSIRLNPFKSCAELPFKDIIDTPVPWCRNAYYLKERPQFTLDPLLHAGAYYVQEASSMYLDEVLQTVEEKHPGSILGATTVLDLCAAPGGKSTLLRAAIPDAALLYSNEPDRKRANILMENIQKQGHPRVIVTNSYPRDYQKAAMLFDVILTDVPCSGEGMFRKDPATIGEWSISNVIKCQELQRSILQDIWPCLKPGGILIYSTCTFNRREDEDNVEWIQQNLGAEAIIPGRHFIPGTDRGEGLFMVALQKTSQDVVSGKPNTGRLRILSDGNPQPTIKGKSIIPAHAEALLTSTPEDKYPRVELTREEAIKYLHHEALVLPPDTPRGFVIVTYQHLPLGFVKNIGNRANNLYPQEWRIRNI